MRMWLCDPSILCNHHISGEWLELFKIVGCLNLKRSISGYVKNNCIEVKSIRKRYEELKREKKRRNHKQFKELPDYDYSYLPLREQEYEIDKEQSLQDLLSRCDKCGGVVNG